MPRIYTAPIRIGGNILDGTSGSVLFVDSSLNVAQNNANFFWDTTNNRLGIGTSTPNDNVEIYRATGQVGLSITSGNGKRWGLISNPAFEPDSFQIYNYSADDAKMVIANNGNAGFGLGAGTPQNKLDVSGAMAVGTYAGANTAPANGMIISGNVGIGTTSPGAQLNVTSAIEIFQTATLTAGSVGSLIIPYDTAAGETDAKGGNLNGAIVVNNADLKIYARTGAVWKGVAIAGFSIPNYKTQNPDDVNETICPLCWLQMKPGDSLGMYADKWYNKQDSKEGLHAVAAHFACLLKRSK